MLMELFAIGVPITYRLNLILAELSLLDSKKKPIHNSQSSEKNKETTEALGSEGQNDPA